MDDRIGNGIIILDNTADAAKIAINANNVEDAIRNQIEIRENVDGLESAVELEHPGSLEVNNQTIEEDTEKRGQENVFEMKQNGNVMKGRKSTKLEKRI